MKEPEWHVSVDRDSCRGSGVCVYEAADRFRLDDGVSSPTSELIGTDPRVHRAADFCPTSAILVRDARTGAVVAPTEGAPTGTVTH
ncbi:ferredoxin [Plantactinospora sp. DSM 117369]